MTKHNRIKRKYTIKLRKKKTYRKLGFRTRTSLRKSRERKIENVDSDFVDTPDSVSISDPISDTVPTSDPISDTVPISDPISDSVSTSDSVPTSDSVSTSDSVPTSDSVSTSDSDTSDTEIGLGFFKVDPFLNLEPGHIYIISINPTSAYLDGEELGILDFFIKARFNFYNKSKTELDMNVLETNVPMIETHNGFNTVFYPTDFVGVPTKFVPDESPRQESVTPRKRYVDTYLNKPVLLNSKSLFQVSIHPDQFTHYRKITESTNIECFIQSLFVLGLRDLTEAKEDVLKLHSKKEGTDWNEATNYIQHSFGLQDGQVTHAWYPGTFSTPKPFAEKINKQLQQLDDNHATILTLKILSPGPPLKIWGHYVVAYKSGQIYYFDPQQNIHSTNPLDLSQNPKNTVIRFGMFYVKDVTTPIPLKTTTCPIEFVGGI